MDRYIHVYDSAKRGILEPSFMTYQERVDALAKVKALIPEGSQLLIEDPNEFSLLPCNEIDASNGFYIVLSFPFFDKKYTFDSYFFHPTPFPSFPGFQFWGYIE